MKKNNKVLTKAISNYTNLINLSQIRILNEKKYFQIIFGFPMVFMKMFYGHTGLLTAAKVL